MCVRVCLFVCLCVCVCVCVCVWKEKMFYLTMHSTHFIYSYMVSDIWLRTILIERKETHCRHTGYSLQLTARVLLHAPSHRQDSTYHGLCYTSRGALAGMRKSSMGSPHEGSIQRPIAPWALTTELHLAPRVCVCVCMCVYITYTHTVIYIRKPSHHSITWHWWSLGCP